MSWKVTLPCTRAEAESAGDAELAGAVIVATEEDEAEGRWRLDAYLEEAPDSGMLAALAGLAPSGGTTPVAEPLEEQDWVTLSQAGLEPIREGRFVVHTPAHPVDVPPGGRAFVIDAGRAFGTGHHETTAGCLAMLETLAEEKAPGEKAPFGRIADLGTGTGLLAFAALELWPEADVLATDIDPVAVEVARENMGANGIDRVRLAVADGARDLPVAEGTAGEPAFDLVIANILAGPLIAMAPEIAGVAAPGAAILLAGLLSTQASAVVDAYAAQGCAEQRRLVRGDWTILLLRAPDMRVASPTAGGDRRGWETDGR